MACRESAWLAAVRDRFAATAAHEAHRFEVNRLWLEYLELAEPVRAPIIRRLLKHDMKDAGMPADELFPEASVSLGPERILDMNSEICTLRAEEERILASFTQRLIEIAAVAGGARNGPSPTAALNAMRLPAIAIDQHGFVVDVNAAADAVFDQNIKIKDKRLFVRDPDARALLKIAIDQLKDLPRLDSLALEPVIVPRMDKLPVIVRIWPFEGQRTAGQEVRAILTLNALGPRPGPSAAILAKTFRLTPSEAKVACIIARGAPPDIAARELKISRETARNQLKSVFAKTDTHRQSELVALLLQVE